jgi:4'-phosphopantetheinyl transferase
MKERIAELQLKLPLDARYFLIDLEEIHVEEVIQARHVLNSEDIERAVKLVFQRDRKRYFLTYALVKIILGKALDEAPQNLSFLRNEFGKPYLFGYPLHFNLSHAGNYAFLGIHPIKSIGVDIEKIDESMSIIDGADSFLFPCEKQWLFSAFKDPREGALTLWCAKEALLKAAGTGFSVNSLPQFTTMMLICDGINRLKGTTQFLADEVDVYVYHNTLAGHKFAVSIL